MKTHPLTQTRALLALIVLGIAPLRPLVAQSAADATSPPPDQTVTMSAFEVSSTQGKGYVSNNAARAFKTDQALLDIPQPDIVVTADMIQDTGFICSSDVLQFVGVSNSFAGETVAIRGNRDTDPYIDDLPDGVPYEDDVFVDSYEVIKGPTSVLYPSASLSGLVIKATKKPLPYPQYIVTETATEWGESRTTIDLNQPMAVSHDLKLAFRFVAALDLGNTYWTNLINKTYALHPSFSLDYKNSSIKLGYDYQYLFHNSQNYSIMTPSGNLWTGWGRRTGGFARDDAQDMSRRSLRVEYLQKISTDWETRFEATYWYYERYGTWIRPNGTVNWINDTETYYAGRDDEPQDDWIMADDTTGHYAVGPIKMTSTFGFNTVDAVSESRITTIGPGPASFGTNDVVTVSIIDPTVINNLVPPPNNSYAFPILFTRSKSLSSNIYAQQQVDAIPDRLSLVAGFTWSNIETVSDTNAAFNAPYSATDASGTAWLHRVGAVLHITKDVVLYALNSTSFALSSGVDVNNNHLPNVNGTGNEVGMKTALLGGRVSSTLSVYRLTLTNQAIVGSTRNQFNQLVSVPIGATTSRGVDGDVEISIIPGFQFVGTAYKGTVENQAGNAAINGTFDNSWSAFMRYDFAQGSHDNAGGLRGLAVGGGIARIGAFWQATAGFTVPSGFILPATIKQHQGSMVNTFAEYRFSRHFTARLNVINLLNQTYVVGGQTPYKVDPSPPRTLSLSVSYRF